MAALFGAKFRIISPNPAGVPARICKRGLWNVRAKKSQHPCWLNDCTHERKLNPGICSLNNNVIAHPFR